MIRLIMRPLPVPAARAEDPGVHGQDAGGAVQRRGPPRQARGLLYLNEYIF